MQRIFSKQIQDDFMQSGAPYASWTSYKWGYHNSLYPWTPKPWDMKVLHPKNMTILINLKNKGNVGFYGISGWHSTIYAINF